MKERRQIYDQVTELIYNIKGGVDMAVRPGDAPCGTAVSGRCDSGG